MKPDAVADIHPERTAALLAALGPERLWALQRRFRDDLAGLSAAAAAGADDSSLHGWAHRLLGSGGTLGLDATAAALATVCDVIAAHPDGAPRAVLLDAIALADAACERGWRALASVLPGPADEHDADDHDAGASNR